MSGWQRKVSLLCLIPACLTWPAWALAQPPHENLEPEMELLEFLGSFEDADAGWVDPFDLASLGADNATGRNGDDDE